MDNKFSHSDSLVTLIDTNSFKRIAEIGIWKGKSCKYILKRCRSIKEYWAIDQWSFLGEGYGHMSLLSQDNWTSLYLRVCNLLFYFKNLKILRCKSSLAAELFKDEYFDLVYIDADHKADAVKQDILAWLPKVKKGGILAGHDYGSRRHREVKPTVNSLLGADKIETWPGLVWIKRIPLDSSVETKHGLVI